MNGVVVEEQLEQMVKVNCLYVQDVSLQAKAVALINARATGQSKLASSVASCTAIRQPYSWVSKMFDACTRKAFAHWFQTLC